MAAIKGSVGSRHAFFLGISGRPYWYFAWRYPVHCVRRAETEIRDNPEATCSDILSGKSCTILA